MTNELFIEKARKIVKDYVIERLRIIDDIPYFYTFVVWNCYILGYQKALISTTLHDDMYYEVTYNKEKNEIYLDAYKKAENRVITVK